MTIVVGVDPGTAPSLALVCSEDGWIDFADEDRVSVKVSKTKRRPVATLIASAIRDWQVLYDIDGVALEAIGAWTGQGIVSTSEFTRAAGIIEGVAAGIGLRLASYRPAQWKKDVGLIKKDKDFSRALALQKWPSAAAWLARKKDHNIAEAALIGWVGIQRGLDT